MINTRLEDKVVLVTGANNPFGIGAAVAKAFATQKAKVFFHYFRRAAAPDHANHNDSPGEKFYYAQQSKSAQEVLDAVRSDGGQASAWEADLSDPAVVARLFDEAEKAFGPVEILVNNAAAWDGDTFLSPDAELPNKLNQLWTARPESITAASFDRNFVVNARAPALMIAEFARRHIRRGARWGRIINISTAAAYCFPSEVSYGASKLALEGYTRSAAVELAQLGITANAVSLGPIQTGWITPELEQAVLPLIPMGRIGTPDDAANAIVFFASEQSGWITGQRLFVGGGNGM